MNDMTNFRKALGGLKKYLAIPVANDRDRAGIIQAFEFTFEQSWKTIQKLASKQGLAVGSPKKAFVAAMQIGWIQSDDESLWLQMITDRNLTSHTYQEEVAQAIFNRIQQNYVRLFDRLLTSLENELG